MYKVNYKDLSKEKTIDNIDSIAIDVIDVSQMRYVDIIYKGDIYLLSLYVKCLKYYNGKVNVFDRFVIRNNFKEGQKIINSVMSCYWLINEDDFENNYDKLEEKYNYFKEEILELKADETLKNLHKCLLMRHFIKSFKQCQKNKDDDKVKSKV